MAVRTLTYRDLTQEQRAKGARRARERLMGLLNNPFLTVEQRQAVYTKIGTLNLWENLQIEEAGTPPLTAAPLPAAPAPVAALPQKASQHHEVGIEETVPTADKVS